MYLNPAELLRLSDYPDYEAHYREHQAFADAVEELHRDFRIRASDALPRQAFEFLKNWLYQHSLEADRAFAEYLKANPAMLERISPASAGAVR